MKPLSLAMGEYLTLKNLYYWELLFKNPILHHDRGLDLFGTKVLQ
jgi:hypothetical protein